MKIKVLKLDENASDLIRGSEQAAGWDLSSNESFTLPAGKSALVKTGIAIEMPSFLYGDIKPRSKLASKYGITILACVIDSDYRGEIMVNLHNTSSSDFEVRRGDKIAQMIIIEHYCGSGVEYVSKLSETPRGKAGINSAELRLR